MNLADFGMDSITLAGPLEAKLAACRAAGFSQIVLWARDLAEHPLGMPHAVQVVRGSGLRVTALQVMRDYEGLNGPLHEYKLDIARHLLQACRAVGARLLLVCSSTSSHGSGDDALIARDLAKLANSAVPMGVRIGYEAQSWGRHVHTWEQAWEVVDMAAHANLGVVLDSFHMLASGADLERLDEIPPDKIALVQLSDFMWRDLPSNAERIETAGHLRVFPGEGSHSAELSGMLRRLDRARYRGDYSLEVVNDDYLQLPPELVCARALTAAKWITDQVLRRSLQVRGYAGQTW
ncbi:sugar phosphate isomerase/epimerase family protein [Massilia niastensis]|uniref:sugar phosphate isomerase/epimerase family protein n=1 Tax=Massilia niastensis TaxID=544911 RepID=UPI00036FCC83|nr:sugar phosphate isomerase/epimerase family protein [Massilia niastensis]